MCIFKFSHLTMAVLITHEGKAIFSDKQSGTSLTQTVSIEDMGVFNVNTGPWL